MAPLLSPGTPRAAVAGRGGVGRSCGRGRSGGAREQPILKGYTKIYLAVKIQDMTTLNTKDKYCLLSGADTYQKYLVRVVRSMSSSGFPRILSSFRKTRTYTNLGILVFSVLIEDPAPSGRGYRLQLLVGGILVR